MSTYLTIVQVNDIKCISETFKIIYWMLPFFLMYFLSSYAKYEFTACYVFHLALLISSIIGSIEYININRRIMGPYGHPNHFGTMLDVLLPFCSCCAWQYYKKNRNLFFSIILFINVAWGYMILLLTGSRGAVLGIVIGAYLSIFSKIAWKKVAVISALLVCIFAYFGYNGIQKFSRSYDYERVVLLESSYNMWKDHKLFGVGLDNWKEYYQKRYILPEAINKKLDMPHNVFAYYFSTTGLVGGIGFCILMLSILVYLVKSSINMSLGNIFCYAMLWATIAITIHGLVDTGITMKSAARLFYACLGLTVSKINSVSVGNNIGVQDDKK